jgi:hypothetical protein
MQKIIFIVNNQFLVKTNENDVEKNFEDFYKFKQNSFF